MSGLGGREWVWRWFAPGTDPDTDDPAITVNLLDDESTGEPVWPRFRAIDVNHGYPVSGARSDKRVGSRGAIARPGYRGARMHTFQLEVKGRTVDEVRQGEQVLRDAFFDQSAEGRMVGNRHPLEDNYTASDERFFNGVPLDPTPAGESEDGTNALWTLGIENADGRYFEELTLAGFKAAILDLEPALYWALDSVDLANDLSPNNRDGTAQGGVTIGGYAAGLLPGISGDSGTDFDGSNDYISSSYNPFAAGSVRTLCGWAIRDTSSSIDTIVGSASATHPALLGLSITPSTTVYFYTDSAGTPAEWAAGWPGNTVIVAWALVFDDTANTAELFIDGASRGVLTQSQAYNSPGNFQIGAYGAGSDPFDGKMSHVAVFERALTAQEIADIHEQATSGMRPYW